ncbi:MAG: type I restriction enzyme HsdR N-terminal domain-containing protein [Bacteroidetes bacterium]|nr:type I restriction enzyme HsdR N-terminal domain-containing protein [Bacteroidota bacterium]
MNHPFKIKYENGKQFIFDVYRKKFVLLTPEEWVRQQIGYYLVTALHYPSILISVEKQIRVGTKKRRYDMVVYKHDKPWMIIECKSEDQVLNEKVLSQLLSYNSTLDVSFLCITNGKEFFVYDIESKVWQQKFPSYLA